MRAHSRGQDRALYENSLFRLDAGNNGRATLSAGGRHIHSVVILRGDDR